MTGDIINQVFAWLPLTAFIIVVAVAYFRLRGAPAERVTLGKTYSCAGCGRRGRQEHMVPVTHEGAVIWYCERCSH